MDATPPRLTGEVLAILKRIGDNCTVFHFLLSEMDAAREVEGLDTIRSMVAARSL